ncbi:MAG: dynamin family protein [Deltaproteobacteria bacterium]|nr:dynamin family protein [Deltaproteobacteria bacterium]
MGLLDDLRRLFADAEVSLVGAREERQEAERALEAGDWFRARAAARRILDRVPHSPIGLALLADACEGAGLDAELEQALAELARVAGSSPDVWLRLGRVRTRVGAPGREVREALTRALAWSDDLDPEKRWSARQARLLLADADLADGNPVRAEGWLAPLDDGTDVLRRRLACAVERRAAGELPRLLPLFQPEVSDAEGQRLLGQAHRLLGNASAAVRALARAAILAEPRAVDALREAIACAPQLDEGALRAAETVAEELGVKNAPLWRAALSAARGEAKVAAAALRDAMQSGVALAGPADRAAARAVAINAHDVALLAKVESSGELAEIERAILSADAASRGEPAEALAALDRLLSPVTERTDEATESWMRTIARALVARIVPAQGNAAWPLLLDRLGAHARVLADLDALRRLELVAAERARPVRIAIVGEFNAGKSTFVNALLGMDVAPTGILPTTAVPHVLKYGPDPIARVRLRAGGARTVAPERLKAVLSEIGSAAGAGGVAGVVAEVEVEVPFSYLQRVEIVDTPGFNAPDPAHARAAMDTLVEGPGVDVAIWLFDVGQPLKTSERRVLEVIVERGIPVQALLNKADRLSDADLDKVLGAFLADAASIGLTSWRPPLAFSARAAVQARIAGDEAALSASRFSPVRALLEDELAEHGDTLKERGLRRRSLAHLSSHAAAAGQLFAQAALLDRAAAIDAGAPTTRQDDHADAMRRGVRNDLREALDAFRRERDELAAREHPSMAPYLERRLVEHLEAAAGRTIAGVLSAEGTAYPLDEIALDASAIARGFAAGGPSILFEGVVEGKRAGRVRGDVEGPLVRALLRTVAARLRAAGQRRPRLAGGGDDETTLPRVRELGAMAEVLAPPPRAGAQQGQ